MKRTIVVVHGVAHRDEVRFRTTVASLARRLDARVPNVQHRLVPAFWGDLGARHDTLAASLPPYFGDDMRAVVARDRFVEHALLAKRELHRHAVRSEDEAADVIADAAIQRASSAGAFAARAGSNVDEWRDAVREAVAQSQWVRVVRDADVLAAIGEIVAAAALEAVPGYEARGLRRDRRSTVARIVNAIDNLLGPLAGEAFGALNHAVRRTLATAVALSFGDIVAYRHDDQGARIRGRIVDTCANADPPVDLHEPVDVLAHSLGGLIVLEMALRGDLRIHHLVTFGSQPAMFHLLQPLPGLAPYGNGRRSVLPASAVARWTNLWHPMDPLAFIASPVFTLGDGSAPRDVRVLSSLSTIVGDKLWMHSAYWDSEELVAALTS